MTALARLAAAITDFCCDAWYTFRPPEDSWAMLGVPYAWRTLGPIDLTPDELTPRCPLPWCRRAPFIACRTRKGGVARTHKARIDKARQP